ncbi:MAG: hypothetical protein IJW49_00405 [Clostridia bacterium]|nr:hypothetical protein [Clostridia bacterium]
MTAKKFSSALGDIHEKYVLEAATYEGKRKQRQLVKWGAIAACVALLATGVTVAVSTIPSDSPTTVSPSDEAGGVNGKINVRDEIHITGEAYAISDEEGARYLESALQGITNDLTASGVCVSHLEIKKTGYSHVRTGDDGNSIALDWRDYLAYDGDTLVGIVHVTKDETGMKHFLSFGGEWFSHYALLLETYRAQELVYLYIGDVEAFITPDNQVISPSQTDVSSTVEADRAYYEYFKTQYNVYVP